MQFFSFFPHQSHHFFPFFYSLGGEIYVDSGLSGRVEHSTLSATQSIALMTRSECCYGLFVDINNNLYCSVNSLHKVIKKSLDNIANPSTIVAGTGSSGSLSNMLDSPWGIFVDINFDLYVADKKNNRIQLFTPGESNGKTLVGNGAPETITLDNPTGVVLDADKYLFIADRHRIVGSGPNGFRTLVGLSSSSGTASNQLNTPTTLSFDRYGNMFVIDTNNNRIQKFILSMNSCSKCLKMFE
jgi:DNA-binding beta-propeller fold protein YncE